MDYSMACVKVEKLKKQEANIRANITKKDKEIEDVEPQYKDSIPMLEMERTGLCMDLARVCGDIQEIKQVFGL